MVSPQAIWKRRRYADPDFREKARATKRAYWATHKDEANARLRERRKTDPKFREREREYRARAATECRSPTTMRFWRARAVFVRSVGRNPTAGSRSTIVM